MGISDFREIKDTFIKTNPLSTIKEYTNNTPVDIYVDGSFYIYTGFVSSNLELDDVTFNPQRVAETVCFVICNIITKIKRLKIPIGDVFVFFDGYKSFSKQKTMNIRRQKKKCLNMTEIKNKTIEIMNENNFIINNLVLGEAEHEMFIHRNTMRPSIMLTDDSDIFHIAYKYNSRTFNDFVFIATKNLNFTCDVNDLKNNFNNIPKMIFTLLCALKGCDYTYHTFTMTMLKTVFNEYLNPSNLKIKKIIDNLNEYANKFKVKENNVEMLLSKCNTIVYNDFDEDEEFKVINGVYSIKDICICIKYLLEILLNTKRSFVWNKLSKYDYPIHKSIYDQLEAITWTVNYSLIGCRYDEYFKNINYPSTLSVFNFYDCILKYEDGDVYDKIKYLNIVDVDRKLFINSYKYGI